MNYNVKHYFIVNVIKEKSMKKFLLLALIMIAGSAYAQDYKNSIGIRLGSGVYDAIGASYKTFITQPGALEFNLGIRPYSHSAGPWKHKWTNVSLSGAYQHHFPIGNISGFKWYIGGGLVFANSFSNHDDYSGVSVGVFPTGGVDYKLKSAPFAFSVDLRPTVHVTEGVRHHEGFFFNGGITARYTF